MAFKPHKTDVASTPPLEYYPGTSGEAFVPGEALVLTGGALTKCGATARPQFICVTEFTCTAANEPLAVIRVHGHITFGTAWSAAAGSVKIGDKVTISADGLFATSTTTSGVAEVVEIQGTAAGDFCAVRF